MVTVSKQRNNLIHALTGIRGYASAWVVLYHFFTEISVLFPSIKIIQPFASQGLLAVEMFFQLSGYILSHNYFNQFRDQPWQPLNCRFLYLRWARIYPIHLATLLIVLLMYLVSMRLGYKLDPKGYTAENFVLNLFMVHAWLPKLQLSWNYPSWSISAEWFAYLVFPFLCYLVARIKTLKSCLISLVLAFFLTQVFAIYYHDLLFHSLFRVFCHFLLGIICFHLSSFVKIRQEVLQTLIWLSSIGIVVGPFLYTKYILLAYSFFPILIFSLANYKSYQPFFASSHSLFWGEVSYSLYMTHTLVQKILYRLLPAESYEQSNLIIRIGIIIVYFLCISLTSILSHYLFENFSRNWLKKNLQIMFKC